MPVASDAQVNSHDYDLLEHRLDLKKTELDKRVQDWCNAADQEADHLMGCSEEVQQYDEQIRYAMGDQWSKKRPSYKSSPVNNRLLRTMEETTAVLTDIRHTFEVKTYNKIFQEQTDILTKTTKSWWVNQRVNLSMALAVTDAYFSTSFLRLVWNRRAANGLGDFEAFPENIKAVKPIGPSHRLQNWEGLIYQSLRPLSWFRREFPANGWKVKASKEHSHYTRQTSRPQFWGKTPFEQLSPQMQTWVGGKTQIVDSVVAQAQYKEFWIRDYSINISKNVVKMGEPGTNWYYEVPPNGLLYPRGRLIITGGDDHAVVYDGPNPHWHGLWPYVCMRLKPVPWQLHGVSELRTKIPHQKIINEILAGTLDLVKKVLNPALIYPSNAFPSAVQATMDPSMPGAKIGYNPMSIASPQYAKPPEFPSFVYNTMQYIQNEMDDDSGLLDLGGMARKRMTPAGDTLSQLKESQQTIMRLRGQHIETAVLDIGEQMIPNELQFYTLPRRMHMHGISGVTFQDVFDYNPKTMVPHEQDPHEYIRNFAFLVTPGSLLNVNRQEHATLAMALRRQGDFSRKSLFEALDMGPLFERVEKELKEEEAEMVKRALMAKVQGLMSGADTSPFEGKGGRNPENLLTPE